MEEMAVDLNPLRYGPSGIHAQKGSSLSCSPIDGHACVFKSGRAGRDRRGRVHCPFLLD